MLTFTETDWFVPHEVTLVAKYRAGDQGRRTVAMCGEIAAPDDATYAAEDDPCFYVVLSEYGDEAAPDANTFDMDVEIVVDEIGEADVADLPLMFQRFTKFWRVTAYVLVNGREPARRSRRRTKTSTSRSR